MASFEQYTTSKGKKLWCVRFRAIECGKEVNKKLKGFSTKHEAEEAYISYRSEALTYIAHPVTTTTATPVAAPVVTPDATPGAPPVVIPSITTPVAPPGIAIPVVATPETRHRHIFDNVFQEYIAARQVELAPATLYDLKKTCKEFYMPFFKGKAMELLTKTDYMVWQTWMWGLINPRNHMVYSQTYLLKNRSLLNTFLVWCEDMYGIQNLLARIKAPKRRTAKKEMQVWTLEQFNQFIAVCDELVWKVFFSLLFFSGCRVGEARALLVTDVHKKGDCYEIVINKAYSYKGGVTPPKTATSNRKVLLPTVMTPLLNEYLVNRTGYLFGEDRILPQKSYERAYDRYLAKTNLPRIRIHDFRHSHATMLITSGLAPNVVSQRLGHSSIKETLDTYSHCYKNADQQAVAAIDNLTGYRYNQQ